MRKSAVLLAPSLRFDCVGVIHFKIASQIRPEEREEEKRTADHPFTR